MPLSCVGARFKTAPGDVDGSINPCSLQSVSLTNRKWFVVYQPHSKLGNNEKFYYTYFDKVSHFLTLAALRGYPWEGIVGCVLWNNLSLSNPGTVPLFSLSGVGAVVRWQLLEEACRSVECELC
ncbi:hypothetical protein ZHAS_00010538 [Anopheles sinensis]|uniref:Uncharacterized protein n=1 Tax=Anopheles sinensis TaxID=74873 RepID=A0A084VXU5_ANOSI|nr:hypothetical protein ZHAS_00010538 [Anopheles sinensis]